MTKRITIKELVTSKNGLGYCCLFCFFKCHKRTGMIAERLGVTDRAVRYHKMAFKDGNLHCEKQPGCLKGKLI